MISQGHAAAPKRISARKLAVLGLLWAGIENRRPTPIRGVTRMQKLVFLVQEQVKNKLPDFRFDFTPEPEKYGPADLQLYQDLDFLEAMGLIRVNGQDRSATADVLSFDSLMPTAQAGEPSLPEEEEEEELSFEYLMGKEPEEFFAAEAEDRETETTYEITPQGLAMLERMVKTISPQQRGQFDSLMSACEKVRSQFGDMPLKTLLRYVYEHFPAYTTNSVIRDQVLGAPRRY
jgi:hypothetical protein